ncbi:MAG TPA: cellulose-binding domain-containing protein [Ktedonobacteraceae bacterium]
MLKRFQLSTLLLICLSALAMALATPTAQAEPLANTTSCKIAYTVNADFKTGFLVSIFITNTGSTPINGWTLQFTFPGNQQITSFFNGSFTQAGQQVAVVNRGYNGTIAPGQTLNGPYPGFVASYSGINKNPTSFTINGQQCSVG